MKRSAILTKIRDLNFFSDQEEDKIRYAWLSIRNDLFKIIILWVVAALLGFSVQFVDYADGYFKARCYASGGSLYVYRDYATP